MNRFRRAGVSALLVVLTSCGASGSPAQRALKDTAGKLDDIRSARMDLRMTAESPAAKGPVGFSVKGPFALPEKKGVPTASLEVTELRGAKSTTATFVATGGAAYVLRNGKATKLNGTGGVEVGGGEGLGTLRIDKWLRDPKLSEGGDTDTITAGLDVAAAFDDLARLGEQFGSSSLAGLKPLDAEGRAHLERSAKDSSVEVVTGADDRLLRKLVVKVTLTAAGTLPEALRSMVPVTLSLTLDLSEVNQPVKVDPPAGV